MPRVAATACLYGQLDQRVLAVFRASTNNSTADREICSFDQKASMCMPYQAYEAALPDRCGPTGLLRSGRAAEGLQVAD